MNQTSKVKLKKNLKTVNTNVATQEIFYVLILIARFWKNIVQIVLKIIRTPQNEIIDLCTKQVVEKCTTEIKDSGMFSILADEAVDISNVEQMPIAIRYVDISNSKSIK